MSDKIERFRGDTYADILEVKADGVVLPNIENHTFKLSVSETENPDDVDYLYQIDGVVTDIPNGLVSFSPNSVQADQEPQRFFYDIQMIDPDGVKRTIKKDEYLYKQDIGKD